MPGFQRLREQTEVVAIWDDHDYGVNDGMIDIDWSVQPPAVVMQIRDAEGQVLIEQQVGF